MVHNQFTYGRENTRWVEVFEGASQWTEEGK